MRSLILLFSISTIILCSNALQYKVQQVHLLYRHGDRSPVSLYPNDPHQDIAMLWPDGLGQLTRRGKAMEYELGVWLRKRYDGLISRRWIPTELEARSTDVDRTLMSAQCCLAAFYYPDNVTKFDDHLNWMPTPIHTSPEDTDTLLAVDYSCPRVAKEKEIQGKLPEIQKVIKENKELFKYLSKHSGSKVNSISNVEYIYDTLEIERLHNLTLPDWTTSVYNKMKEFSNLAFKFVALSEEMKRLKAGPLIGKIGNDMMMKVDNESNTRLLYMYSGHDTTVSVLQLGLRVFNNIAPPYASTIMIELLNTTNSNNKQTSPRLQPNDVIDYYVRMYYRNSTSELYELILPGCSHTCPLAKWIKISRSVVPDDWYEECRDDSVDRYFVEAVAE